ncbi:MAG TPA: dihydrolipoamide acetyltransferase family protein [Phycisphaerales bacterium]|nr:dihydrolipoamide acetyltransferase family protein [Phycisphaerales bacterium]
MPIDITMPRLSDTMQQGTIVKWNVKEGQKVKSGDVIADIETDKATMELQSFDDGVVAAIPVPQGQTVPVGTVMLVLATTGEDVAAVKAKAGSGAAPAAKAAGGSASNAPAAAATAVMEPTSNGVNGSHGEGHGTGGRIFISPLARKIADEAGLDVSRVQGSGPGGRIVRKDVEEAIAAGGPTLRGGSAPATSGGAKTAATSAAPEKRPTVVPAAAATLAGKLIPVSNMRRVIAQRLSESKSSIPHYQVSFDVDMQPLMALRAQLNEQLANQGVKLSVNDFLVKACALAMHQHPYVNARWVTTQAKHGQMDTSIEYLPEVNVGIAIALPINEDGTGGGLVVATLRNADSLGLRQISAQSKQLAEKARGKGLAPNEMSDSTFTISNLGMYGVSHFNAIINPPNVAILAVGGAIEKPVVRNGKIEPGLVMTMTMSSDHRVVDGAMAAQYLATVKNFLEKPATLLV